MGAIYHSGNYEQMFVICEGFVYSISSERAVPSESLQEVGGIPMRTLTQLLLAVAIVMALAIALISLLA